MTDFTLRLNGRARTVPDANSRRILLDWLRETEGLAGTKEGCAEGDCGACSVLVSPPAGGAPLPANACLLTLGQVAGLAITTVEGLGTRERPHPLQSTLARAGGTQCGYCTPGFVVAGAALLDRSADPDDAAIHDALSGNLCRCTGYRAIVEAVHEAAGAPQRLPRATVADVPQNLGGVRFPASLDEAVALHSDLPGARYLAGGTDLVLAEREVSTPTGPFVSLARIPELTGIRSEGGVLVLGGACPIENLLPEVESRWPHFGKILRRFGSVQIRSQATLGGNLATASPIGDAAPCLIALGATIGIHGPAGRRSVPVDAVIAGYRQTCLAPGELIASIEIPEPAPATLFRAWKVSKRYDQDISTLSAAFWLERDDRGRVRVARAAFGGMADRPLRCPGVESAIVAGDFGAAADSLAEELSPIDDFRGSAAYRLLAARGLIERLALDLTGERRLEVMEL